MRPRIALACSGVGCVGRGNERWALTAADALHAAGVDVTLFGGAPELAVSCPYVRLPSLPRESRLLSGWVPWGRRYLLEQMSFAFFLERRLRRERFDVLHIHDPHLALRMRQLLGPSGPPVIYGDGLFLGTPWCRKFDMVQVLAPYYRQEAETEGIDTRRWFVIPHPVDLQRFAPSPARALVRAELLGGKVPDDRSVILAVGDFSLEGKKRLDWVVQEVARLPAEVQPELIVVGQATPREEREFRSRAEAALGGRVHVVSNVAAEEMPRWYQIADIFFHAALREPFGNVFVEAMATALPVVAHSFPVTEWIVGAGGKIVDMTQPGAAAAVLELWLRNPELRRGLGEQARERTRSVFSTQRVVPLYVEAYEAAVAGR